MSNEITVIKDLELVPFFTKGDSVDDVLQKIAKEVRSLIPDVSTLKGRNAIKANVTTVTRSKTYLEANGKELAAEYKEIPKKIDANRKKVKDFLNDLQYEIRKPLTDWEEEQERTKEEEKARLIAEENQRVIDADYELAVLLMEKDFSYRAEQEELARQARVERENEVARIAAEKAKHEAEEEAKAERDRIQREKIEANQREEAAIKEAERLKEAQRIDYHQRMIKHISDCGYGFIGGQPQPRGLCLYELTDKIVIDDSFEEFESEALSAKKEAIARIEDSQKREDDEAEESEKRRLADIEEAKLAEAERIENERLEQERIARARAEDVENKRKVNNEILVDLINAGLTDEQAKLAIKAMAKNQVRNVRIIY